MIKRYGVRTGSGSWYLLECHTHLIGHLVWKIITEKGEYFVSGLIFEGKDPIKAADLKSIKDFMEYQIFYDDKEREFAQLSLRHTSPIEEYIEFK